MENKKSLWQIIMQCCDNNLLNLKRPITRKIVAREIKNWWERK